MSLYQDYFVTRKEDIPENFIKFCIVDTHVKSTQLDPELPVYFGIDNQINSHRLSEVTIDQVKNNEVVHIAWFYKWYNYTQGISSLIQTRDNINYYRFSQFV